MRKISGLFSIFIFCSAIAQQKPPVSSAKPISSDCAKPVSIKVASGSYYGPTVTPDGPGAKRDLKAGNSLIFDGEHNTAWYLLTMDRSGQLIFDILPNDSTNDYDFLLYKYSDSTFCNGILSNTIKPLRSNLSNIRKSVKGITGLRENNENISIGEGIGESFSRPITVQKGEKYMLVLDNVTPSGAGHIIRFFFLKDVKIKGTVVNSSKANVRANITLSDNSGQAVKETQSDEKGQYKIDALIREDQNYSLTYLSDSEFVQIGVINTRTLQGKSEFPDIRTVMPRLKKGEKYKLGNINFYGNVAILLPESKPSVEALCKLMKKNKKMIIEIQGHVNDPKGTFDDVFNKVLSEERANTVYDYLLKHGIEKERVSKTGLSNKFPIYTNPGTEAQQSANRRVEIKVISLDGK